MEYKQFASFRKWNEPRMEEFQKEFCPIGIFQFRNGGAIWTPDNKPWYLPLGNRTLVPAEDVEPELPESIEELCRESYRLDLAIQAAESIQSRNAEKMRESLGALNFLMFGHKAFPDLFGEGVSPDQQFLNGLSVLTSVLDLVMNKRMSLGILPHFWDQGDLRKFQRKSSSKAWEESCGSLLYDGPRSLLGQFWQQFILDFLIRKRTIGHCRRCGNVFSSTQTKAEYCPPPKDGSGSGCAALERSARQYDRKMNAKKARN